MDPTLNHIEAFWSDGKYSLHKLLLDLLEQTGSAEVWLSTFSVSDTSLRAIGSYMSKGLITSLHCLFDNQVLRHKASLFFFAENITPDIKIASCHAKVLVIQNKLHSIVVIGSANFTENLRHECGVIIRDANVVEYFKNKIEMIMADAMPVKL